MADYSCAHCLVGNGDGTYRCRECGDKVVCEECAGEAGLKGEAVMLAIAAAKEKQREKKDRVKAFAKRKPVN